MTEQRIRVAVIGAGSMGQNHIRIFSQMKHVDLIGVYDLNTEHGAEIAKRYGCKLYSNLEEVVGEVDAVSICTPSTTHHDVAVHFIKKEIHCLIEKPLATNDQDAKSLINLSEEYGVQLLVGHVEQFNPAVMQLKAILNAGDFKINNIKASRVGVGGARIKDVGVVEDIMIHDLDVILSIVEEVPESISSEAVQSEGSESEDLCVAMLKFPSGIISDITASRITHKRNRILEIDTDQGVFVLNYFTQELELHHHKVDMQEQDPLSSLGAAILDTRVEKVLVRRAEPLTTELNHFISMITNGDKAIVSGFQALQALSAAWSIKADIA